MLFLFIAYVVLIAMLLLVERIRIRGGGPDLASCFLGLFSIQTIVPATVVIAVLAFYPGNPDIRRSFFERVYQNLDVGTALHVFVLTVLFLVFFYLTYAAFCGSKTRSSMVVPRSEFYVSMRPWVCMAIVGLVLSWVLLSSLGGGIGAYARLIQFRAGDPTIERNFVTANLFSLTQTFSLIAIVGVVVYLKQRRLAGIVFSVVAALVFSLMTASRRALFIQLLLIYFVFVLDHRQFFVKKWLLPIGAIGLPAVMYGKELLGSIAFGTKLDWSDFGIGSLVRAVMDIGITMAESWATLMFLHEPMRFGIDHILSAARRIPEGLLGLDIDFPERIVRISTGEFVGWNEADLPPGFFGQMWLDWGYAGPVVWGIGFGIQLGLLQKLYDSIGRSVGIIALFVIALFIVALPVNTGSFDFTFSVDMIMLVVLLSLLVRGRVRSPGVQVGHVPA